MVLFFNSVTVVGLEIEISLAVASVEFHEAITFLDVIADRPAIHQQQQGDQQREDAERFGHGEAENQAAAHLGVSFRVADGTVQVLTEDRAHADSGQTSANRGQTSADNPCRFCVHDEFPCLEKELEEELSEG